MIDRFRRRLTYANVISTIALFLALSGGVAWAATSLKRNSVKSAQIAPGAVVSSDIKDRAIRLRDLSKEVTGASTNGKNGLQGPKGDPGSPGADLTFDGRRMSQTFESIGTADVSRDVATVGPLTVTLTCRASTYAYWIVRVTSTSASPTELYGAVEATKQSSQSVIGYDTAVAGAPAGGIVIARAPSGNPDPRGTNWGLTVVLPDGTIQDVRSIVRRVDLTGTDNDRCIFPAKALVERVSQVG